MSEQTRFLFNPTPPGQPGEDRLRSYGNLGMNRVSEYGSPDLNRMSQYGSGGLPDWLRGTPKEPEYQRNFMDRVFAPLNATQQFLFHATKSISDDGFQLNTITKALGHAARYGNPNSEVQEIAPEEIRRVFFGEGSDNWNPGRRLGADVAFSLLYDPLLFINPAKIAGSMGQMAAKTTIGKFGIKLAEEAGGKIPTALKEKYAQGMQGFINRHWGLPEQFMDSYNMYKQNMFKWQTSAHRILKSADDLGGENTGRLLAQALESEAVWLARSGKTPLSDTTYKTFQHQLKKQGIDEGQFWGIYDSARALDDTIGEGLLKAGLIDPTEYTGLAGKHLRRMYNMFDNPEDVIDNLSRLSNDASLNMNRRKMFQGLNSARKLIDDLNMSELSGLMDATTKNPNMARYFLDNNTYRFNTKNFVNDLDAWMKANPTDSVADVMRHVQQDMLGGAKMPAALYQKLGEGITGGVETTAMISKRVSDVLSNRFNSSAVGGWHKFDERLELVAKRENLPESIRQAMGEVMDFAPRLASQATDVANLLETRRFLDFASGTKRVWNAEKGVWEAQRIGTNFASTQLNEALGHSALIRGSQFGSLDGMYTSPAMKNFISEMEGVRAVGNTAEGIWEQVGKGVRFATGKFKVSKVVIDPIGQARNAVSDLLFMDAVGVLPLDARKWGKAMNEIKKFGEAAGSDAPYYIDLAGKVGMNIFEDTFSANEIKKAAKALSGKTFKNPAESVNGIESLFQSLAAPYNALEDAGSAFLQAREQLFKMTAFITHFDRLAGGMARAGQALTDGDALRIAKQARTITEKALFNYNEVPVVVDFIRKYGIVPFIAFPFKAIPSITHSMVTAPWNIAKYPRTVEALSMAHMEAEKGNATYEKRMAELQSLPRHLRDKMVLRLPFSDKDDRPLYIDTSFLMPWYTIQDAVEAVTPRDDTLGPDRMSMLNPPLLDLTMTLFSNRTSVGAEVIKPYMKTEEKLGAWFKQVWQTFTPTVAPGGVRAEALGKALMSLTSHTPEPTDLQKFITQAASVYGGNVSDPVGSTPDRRFRPQSQAIVGADLGNMNPYQLGLIGGAYVATGNVLAADALQARSQDLRQFTRTRKQTLDAIKKIRMSNLSNEQKTLRINALIQEQRDAAEELRRIQNIREQ